MAFFGMPRMRAMVPRNMIAIIIFSFVPCFFRYGGVVAVAVVVVISRMSVYFEAPSTLCPVSYGFL